MGRLPLPLLLLFFLAWEAEETAADGTSLAPGFSCLGLVGVTTEVALMKGPHLS